MTATERAYKFAKERILDGRFAAGSLISEGEVASAVNLSRTPVREAFLRLESDGLLRLYPRRGALVISMSPAEVQTVMEARLLVERDAVEKILRREVPVSASLEESLSRQSRMAERQDYRSFIDLDRDFHRILVAAADNPIILGLYDSLRDRLTAVLIGSVRPEEAEERIRKILGEHRELVDAIAAGDAPLADRLITKHLQETLNLLRGSSLSAVGPS